MILLLNASLAFVLSQAPDAPADPKWYESDVPVCTGYLTAGVQGAQNNILDFMDGRVSTAAQNGARYVTLHPADYHALVSTRARHLAKEVALTANQAASMQSAYNQAADAYAGRTVPLAADVAATVVGFFAGRVAGGAIKALWSGLLSSLRDDQASDFARRVANHVALSGTLRNVMFAMQPDPPLPAGALPGFVYVIFAQEYRVQLGAETRTFQLRSCRVAVHLDYQAVAGAPAAPTSLRLTQ